MGKGMLRGREVRKAMHRYLGRGVPDFMGEALLIMPPQGGGYANERPCIDGQGDAGLHGGDY